MKKSFSVRSFVVNLKRLINAGIFLAVLSINSVYGQIDLSLESFRIDDFGTNDGIANGSELVSLVPTLKNNGTETALDVVATLSSTSTAIGFRDTQAFFGTIDPSISFEQYGWSMDIVSGTPEGTVIDFEVTVTASNGGPFMESFSITTGPPIVPPTGPFVLESFSLNDSPLSSDQSVNSDQAAMSPGMARLQAIARFRHQDRLKAGFKITDMDSQPLSSDYQFSQDTSIELRTNGNGDGIPNGGEIIDILPVLRNDGNDAFGVDVVLSSTSPFVSIISNYTGFGTLLSGESKTANFYLTFAIRTDTPENTQIDFHLGIFAIEGLFDANFSISTGPPIALPQAVAEHNVLYGSTGFNGGDFLTIDPQTGTGTLIGNTGISAVPGLAINSSGEIFGSYLLGGLFRIDAATGIAGLVANTSVTNFQAIAFDENDVLFGIAETQLYTIDPITGTTTLIGDTGVRLRGMAFDPTDGTLWASSGGFQPDEIYTIDPATGAATFVGTTGLGGATPDIAFDFTGNLFGSKGNDLISIDKSTGMGTVIGQTGFRVSGMASRVSLLPGSQISVSADSIDFGTVIVGEASTPRTVNMINVGDTDLTITDISDSNEGFHLNNLPALPVEIPPRGTESFDVTFSPTRGGDFSGTITISSNDPDDSSKEISLTGNGLERGVLLSLESIRINDYFGKSDGIVNPGEVVRFLPRLRNQYADDALDVVATLSSEHLAVTRIITSVANFGTVPFGVTNENLGWRVEFSKDAQEGTVIDFDVTITAANAGPFTDGFSVTVGPLLPPATGPFVLEGFELDDAQASTVSVSNTNSRISAGNTVEQKNNYLTSDLDFTITSNTADVGTDTSITLHSSGNGDGIPNGGEIITIRPTLRNDGSEAHEVVANLSRSSPFASIIESSSVFGTISTGESVPAFLSVGTPWLIGIPVNTPEDMEIVFDVEVQTFVGGPFTTESFTLTTGPSQDISKLALAEPGICYASTGRLDGGRLLTIDTATGAGTLVGPTGINYRQFITYVGVPGLAINSEGEIFGSDRSGGLSRIDATTGAATFIAGTGLDRLDAIAFDAFDILFGIQSTAANLAFLYTIDTQSGETDQVGYIGQYYLSGMAFDPTTNILYASSGGGNQDEILTIYQTTGVPTLVGVTGLGNSTPDIHFDDAGNLYGVKGGGQDFNNFLISIDKSTGAGSVIGPIGFFSISGLASRLTPLTGPQITALPDPLDFGNILFGSSVNRTVTISNVGSDTLGISDISISAAGSFNLDLESTMTSVPAKQTTEFQVTFAAGNPGTANATITIANNDEQLELNVSGKSVVLNPAVPGVLYGANWHDFLHEGLANFISINPETGVGSLIGPLGMSGAVGMAINSKGEIFATQPIAGDLYRIDAATGAAVFVAKTGVPGLNSIDFDQNDMLYGAESARPSILYKIDPVSGDLSRVSSDLGVDFVNGLAFDPGDGTLWCSAEWRRKPDGIFTIDITTGITTLVGYTGFGTFTPDIHFDTNRNLFGTQRTTPFDYLISIDKTTGAGTTIGGSIGFPNVSAIAFGKGIQGDVNRDGVVNVQDLIRVINIILNIGEEPSETEIAAADLNGDGVINVQDLIAIINTILGIQFSVALESDSPALSSAEIFLQDFQASERGLVNLPVSAKLDGAAAAAVFVMNYDPNSLSVTEPTLGRDISGFNLISGSNDGEMIAVLFSQNGKLIEPGESNLFSLPVTVKGNNNGNGITLETAQFVGVKGEIIEVGDGKVTSSPQLPKAFGLSQNYPNPFNPSTTINFEIPETKQGEINVKLNIYNVRGQLVKTLMDEEKAPGYYSIHCDGRNETGQMLSSGIYYFQIDAGDYKKTKKMVLLK